KWECEQCQKQSWSSQPRLRGRYFEGNVKFTSAAHTTGLPFPRVSDFADVMGLALPAQRTIHDLLVNLILPSVDHVYVNHMRDVRSTVRNVMDYLSSLIDLYTNEERITDFQRRFDNDHSIIGRSFKENEELAQTALLLLEWASHVGGLSRRFREEVLLALFVLFGLGDLPGLKRKYMQKPSGEMRIHAKKGEHLLDFIEFVSSREFRVRSSLSFSEIGGGILTRGEWRAFSEASLTSFLSLVTHHRLDLPMNGGSGRMTELREYHRVIQLPNHVITNKLENVGDALRKVSRCKDVKLRKFAPQLASVSVLGTSGQLRILSSYIYIPPAPPREIATMKGAIEGMTSYTYDRLMAAVYSPSLE
ncbi:hypothetical protein PENTCL1PPCAC_23537, partial [Pristionchus entomophagus]